MSIFYENKSISYQIKHSTSRKINPFLDKAYISGDRKRATGWNNVGGENSWGEYTGVERSGGNFPGGVYLEPNYHTVRNQFIGSIAVYHMTHKKNVLKVPVLTSVFENTY